MPAAPSLDAAFERFDAANACDPNRITVDGAEQPRELVFAKRLTDCVLELRPDAPAALLLASRCQHICRWEVPRNTEAAGRAGYLKWRAGLKKFHATKSTGILRELGFPDETIERVRKLNLKENLKSDPDCQTLEDALCLVFLRYQFDDLIAGTESEKMIRIVKKTWAKMSSQGHAAAQQIEFSAEGRAILEKCL